LTEHTIEITNTLIRYHYAIKLAKAGKIKFSF